MSNEARIPVALSPRLDEAWPIRCVEPAAPCTMVIFGATGDLAARKLIPALYNLRREGFAPEDFSIIGVATRQITSAELRDKLLDALREHLGDEVEQRIVDWLAERIRYVSGDFRAAETYAELKAVIADSRAAHNTGQNVLFYLSTPPSFFGPIVEHLAACGLTSEADGAYRRVIIEKPFGHDTASAIALNHEIQRHLDEDQLYRIDHYLGKETVQNIEMFRFANGIFEPLWNRQYIDHVQITVAESIGVGHRAKYYEEAGALRDMVPNHLFQVLALIAMEPPTSLAASAVRNEKAKIFDALTLPRDVDLSQTTVRGQYGSANVEGEQLNAYREEPGVAEQSHVETYAAMKLAVESWRWMGVPFYLRVGKRLPKRSTQVVVQFKAAPLPLFNDPHQPQRPNQLVIRIQPREGIELRFDAKIPGPGTSLAGVRMDFCYAEVFTQQPTTGTGYETLLYDAMRGDATLFQRADHVEASWRVVEPILERWANEAPQTFPNYAAGSWGPREADELLARDGRHWHNP